jgi:hypothetical protein
MKKLLIASIILVWGLSAHAAPSISGVSGTISHGQSITISGSGFGSKSTAAPAVWDNCSGTDVLDKWDVNYNADSGSSYAGAYRTPASLGRNVALPHSNITKYFCGAHYPGTSAQAGWNVGVAKNRTVTSWPCYSYISFYNRADPSWTWSADSTDDNYKEYDWSRDSWPYGADNWYLEYYYRSSWHLNDDSTDGLARPISGWHQGDHWNVTSSWMKVEMEIRHDTSSSGYIKVWENGVLKVNFTGQNTWASTGTYNELIGGFARDRSTSNWRYFADMYLDYSLQRVMIGNASTLASSTTLREVQIPSAWSASSITVTVNQGGFANGSTAYLYVFDDTGTANSTGYAITFGDTPAADTTPPTVTITTSDPQNVSTSSVSISWTDSDDTGVTARKWRIGSAPDASNGTTATSPATVTGLSIGANTVYIGAGDAAGNWGSDSITVNYTPASTSPTMSGATCSGCSLNVP